MRGATWVLLALVLATAEATYTITADASDWGAVCPNIPSANVTLSVSPPMSGKDFAVLCFTSERSWWV